MGYGVWLHGEAVAAGIVMAAELSLRMKLINDADVERIRALFLQANLPVVAPKMKPERYLELMLLDKKWKLEKRALFYWIRSAKP